MAMPGQQQVQQATMMAAGRPQVAGMPSSQPMVLQHMPTSQPMVYAGQQQPQVVYNTQAGYSYMTQQQQQQQMQQQLAAQKAAAAKRPQQRKPKDQVPGVVAGGMAGASPAAGASQEGESSCCCTGAAGYTARALPLACSIGVGDLTDASRPLVLWLDTYR
jgi:hypothetical protein